MNSTELFHVQQRLLRSLRSYTNADGDYKDAPYAVAKLGLVDTETGSAENYMLAFTSMATEEQLANKAPIQPHIFFPLGEITKTEIDVGTVISCYFAPFCILTNEDLLAQPKYWVVSEKHVNNGMVDLVSSSSVLQASGNNTFTVLADAGFDTYLDTYVQPSLEMELQANRGVPPRIHNVRTARRPS